VVKLYSDPVTLLMTAPEHFACCCVLLFAAALSWRGWAGRGMALNRVSPIDGLALARRTGGMMGEGRRPEAVAGTGESPLPQPEITLRQISTWSLATLAAVAVGLVLYAAREVMLPVAAAFVVGIMLGPAARRLEALRVPRALTALLLVAVLTLSIAFVILLIFPRVSELTSSLPSIVASLKEKLHVFDGLVAAWRRLTSMIGEPSNDAVALPLPGISWVPPTISILLPPITGFLFFLVVLLLVISEWPGLRRGLVMTFASRDSRLRVLKILNEIESGLANYLLIVTLINVCVGALTGVICALTGMPNAVGFGALAATLNFVPIVGPIAMFVVLVVVGVVAEPTFALGLLPAGGFLLLITVEGQFLTPTIIGRHLELNALAVLLSLAFWTWLWGPMGAFLSSPILMVALILKQRLYVDEDR
jgi:predicted PurR-regulated permease PerM